MTSTKIAITALVSPEYWLTQHSLKSPCIFQHFYSLLSDWLWFVFQISFEKLWPNLSVFKVSWQSDGCGKVYTYGLLYLMDDFLSQVWQLKTTPKAWRGHAGAGTDNTRFALGCTPRTHCKWPSEILGAKSAYSINSIKKPRCCPIIPLFFHIIPYLRKKQPVNYLTRGVKKTFQIVAVEENVWALITTIWPPMC